MTVEYTQPAASRKWYEIWWDIWSKPGDASFQALLSEPNHSTGRAFIWIAVVSLIVAIMTGVTSTQTLQSFEPGITSNLVYFICTLILSPIFGIIGLVISSGIYHLIARLLGGSGTWSDLVVCQAAVFAPSELIGGVIGLFTILLFNIPGLFFLPGIITFVIGVYAIILMILALKAAEKFGTGKAVLTHFIPVIIIGLLVLCAFLALVPALTTRG
jgi:hypothetical protein